MPPTREHSIRAKRLLQHLPTPVSINAPTKEVTSPTQGV